MKRLLATLCQTIAVLLGSAGVSASADSSQQTIGLIQSTINAIISNEKKSFGDNLYTDQAVKLDLDLDGNIDLGILDESGFSCPKFGASYYCGSAGCSIHLITTADYMRGHVRGWEIISTKIGGHYGTWLGLASVIFATVNVVGGFMVTDRMLKMFKRK